MKPSGSYAVMSSRVEPSDSIDDFPTPSWATRALCEILHGWRDLTRETAWEPACGRGYMARPLGEYFSDVQASDVHDYGTGYMVQDFLWPDVGVGKVDWIITNPPFKLAEEFILRGLALSRVGVAVFVRTVFLEGCGRYRRLYWPRPPAHVLQFTERVPLVKGRVDPTISSASSYCWVVWMHDEYRETRLGWIPPCRKMLERPGDYQ